MLFLHLDEFRHVTSFVDALSLQNIHLTCRTLHHNLNAILEEMLKQNSFLDFMYQKRVNPKLMSFVKAIGGGHQENGLFGCEFRKENPLQIIMDVHVTESFGGSEISIQRWVLELSDNGKGLLNTRLTRLKVLDGDATLHASQHINIPLGDSDTFHTEEKLKELLRALIVQSVEKKSSKEVVEKLKVVQNQLKLSKTFDLKTDNLIDYSFCFTIKDNGIWCDDVEWLSVDVFVNVGNEKMFDLKRLAVKDAAHVVNPPTESCNALFKAVSQYCGFSETQEPEVCCETHSSKEWEELGFESMVNINNMNDDDFDEVPLEMVMDMVFENPLFYKQKEARIGNKHYPVCCFADNRDDEKVVETDRKRVKLNPESGEGNPHSNNE